MQRRGGYSRQASNRLGSTTQTGESVPTVSKEVEKTCKSTREMQMAAEGGAFGEPDADASRATIASCKQQGSKQEREWNSKERRLSFSGRGDATERMRGGQLPKSLDHRLAAIKKTHAALLEGIDAAQDNMSKMMQEQEALYLRAFKMRTQEILEQAKKFQKSQKPPLEIETLHQMLTASLLAAEEEAKHFAELNKALVEKNAELNTNNELLKQQNELLMREKVIQRRQNEKPKDTIISPRKSGPQGSPQLTPDISPRLPGPPLTPRTVAKVKAKIRQCSKTRDYERELKMRAELSRLHALCNRQKEELIKLRATDGRRAELELLLKGCLLDVKARLAGKRSRGVQGKGAIPCDSAAGELSTAGRDEVLKKFLRMQQVIKLLYQIVSAASPATQLDLSWLEEECDEELQEGAVGCSN